jgi:hypothetical protein
MPKNQKFDQSTDAMALPLGPDRDAMDHSLRETSGIPANNTAPVSHSNTNASIASWVQHRSESPKDVARCRKKLWFSFFFDGTGNNLEADVGSLKHSNIARLYRVHSENNDDVGNFRIYIPGVGTYFPEIGDKGGGVLGLVTGYRGEDRLKWALNEFDSKLKAQVAGAATVSNMIEEVNIAVFGFSRGAALARAFVNMFIDSRCKPNTSKCCLILGGYSVRIRFLGLFDTVASVGRPMSTNNTSKVSAVSGTIVDILKSRNEDSDYANARPNTLAFQRRGYGGADPTPGDHSGHDSWGAAMKIPSLVEEVRHFIAAHEIRNSFPVESVSALSNGMVSKPGHFYETVYPGVHSDVGGSYRPGEGARSERPDNKLGLVPLRHMYDYAVARGVPLLPPSVWRSYHKADFEMSPDLVNGYNAYLKALSSSASLGDIINAHMKLYFGWRFRSIRRKRQGDVSEGRAINKNGAVFAKERRESEVVIRELEIANKNLIKKLDQLEMRKADLILGGYRQSNLNENLKRFDTDIGSARKAQARADDQLLRARAKLDALPNMDALQSMVILYDNALLNDVLSIYSAYSPSGNLNSSKRAQLQPHYKVMMDAYEDEFSFGRGLTDPSIINFFDKYVHDSLAAFAKDATPPSDPRVVFLGGDKKYQYASNSFMDAWPVSVSTADRGTFV